MQFNKASKKTRNLAEETIAAAPENNAAGEGTSKPRTTRSSKMKKAEITEAGPVNHHHKASSASDKPKTAAAAATSGVSTSSIVDPVGVVTPAVEPQPVNAIASASTPREVTHEEVAKLAYSYWIARGYGSGGAEQDWLRAEQELKAKR